MTPQKRFTVTARATRVITAALVGIVVVALGAFSLFPDGDGPNTKPQATSEGTPPSRICKAAPSPDPCFEVSVGERIWRYSVSRPAQDIGGNEAILVDFGGPGTSLLSGHNRLAMLHAMYPHLAKYTLVAIEEPWVTADVSVHCDHALSEFYRAARKLEDLVSVGERVQTECRLKAGGLQWGYDPRSFREVVSAAISAEGLRTIGMIAFSWGAVRRAYLTEDLEFAVYVRPFPVGASADDLLTSRVESYMNLGWLAPDGLSRVAVPDRSLPIEAFDGLSAVVALAYVPPDQRESAITAVSAGSPGPIGRLSDGLWGRYGRDLISASMLAQFQEVCNVVGGTSTNAAPRSIEYVLHAMLAPCGASARLSIDSPTDRQKCVVTSTLDPVAPGNLVRASRSFAGSMFVDSSEPSHVSMDGLEVCLKSVLT